MSLAGGCLCGAVRFRIEGEPITARQCWCRDCQYLAAGSGTNNLFVRTEQLDVQGELAWFDSVADSGNVLARGFCPRCGTPVAVQSHARRHLIAVRLGTLDDPAATRPAQIIWSESAPAWACLDPALPRVARQPPPVA